MRPLTFGSLFSGVGGFDLGLEAAGMRCAWQVEIDPQARAVLRRHWPNVDLHEDVRDAGSASLAPVDLICGGFPCQDLSVAGRRQGLDGARSGLWYEFRRIVGELLPRWVLVENVPGLRSSWSGDSPGSLGVEAGPGGEMVLVERSDLNVVTDGLAELGYVGAWRSLDARHFGVAQRRERIFLLACRDSGAGCPAEVLAIPEGLSGHPAPGAEAREGAAGFAVSGTLDARQRAGGFPGTDGAASGHVVTGRKWPADIAHTLRAEGFDASEDGTGRGTPLVAVTPIDMRQASRGEKLTNNRAHGSGGPPGHGVGEADDPAFTVSGRGQAVAQAFDWQSGGDCRGLNPADRTSALHVGQTPAVALAIPRRLTPTECERLMGWPDSHTAWGVNEKGERVKMADGPRYRMCGNGVVASVAEWIGRRIVAAEQVVRDREAA